VTESLREILERRFSPQVIEILDETDAHRGHAEAKLRGGGHYAVTVVAQAFDGKTLIERHRMIYDAVFGETKETVHALAIKAFTPVEWQKSKEK